MLRRLVALALVGGALGFRAGPSGGHVTPQENVVVGAAAPAVDGRRRRPHAAARAGGRGSALRRLIRAATAASAVAVASGAVDEYSTAELLAAIDHNKDGTIDWTEYLTMANFLINTRGYQDVGLRQSFVEFHRQIFERADTNGDGRLTEREMDFAETLAQVFELDEEQLMSDGTLARDLDLGREGSVEAMAYLDIDGDSRLSAAEQHTTLLRMIGYWSLGGIAEEPEVQAWMRAVRSRADINEDGYHDHAEALFAHLVGEAELQGGIFADKALARLMVQELDRNSDGVLEYSEIPVCEVDGPEVQTLGLPRSAPHLLRSIRDHFDEADANGDKRLGTREVSRLAEIVVDHLGAWPLPLPDELAC